MASFEPQDRNYSAWTFTDCDVESNAFDPVRDKMLVGDTIHSMADSSKVRVPKLVRMHSNEMQEVASAMTPTTRLESRNSRARCLLPSAKPDPNFAVIHSSRIRDRRNDAMRNTLPPAP